ncbi:MAG: hypothetical protein GX804_02030 [Lentisphaerae bacterium]|jgi:type IV secretory pathway TrbL component|nr:hypothetical protein [Lentisphaerota bacterium]
MNSGDTITKASSLPEADTRAGQVLVEYLIVTCVIILVVVVLSFLLYALRQNGNRVLDLVASEYP